MTEAAEWWSPDVSEGTRHSLIFNYVRALEEAQWEIRERDLRHGWLYDQTCKLLGVDFDLRQYQYATPTPVTENIVRSVIDTATAMVARNRPRIAIVTNGADFKLQRKADQLERFIEAEFKRMNVYADGVRMFRDAGVYGTGALFIYEHRDRPKVERVAIDEITIDNEEARSSPPRQMHRRKFVDKAQLKAEYPDFAVEIEKCAMRREWTTYRRLKPRQVAVIESWHLPSVEGADDGRHTISIENVDLVDEDYTDDWFPFVWYRWGERLNGFYGIGIAEVLVGVQLRINRHNRFIATAQDRIAIPRVYVQTGDAAIKVKLTNAVGQIIPYRGKKPEFETPVAVSPEIYANKRELRQNAYQDIGISEMSISARKPVGLESAPALREYNDIETQRFSIQAQTYEETYPEIARQILVLSKRIAARTGNYATTWNSRNLRKLIPWKDVDLEEDEFSMSLETASILSRSPAGRKQEAIELSQAGLIDTDEARMLIGHPDIDRALMLENAARNDAERVCEMLSDEDAVYTPPMPLEDLEMCRQLANQQFLVALGQDAPQKVLDRFLAWIEQADYMMQSAQAGAAQPGAQPGMQAGAPPAPGAQPGAQPMPQGNAQPQAPTAPQAALAAAPNPAFGQ